MSTTGALGRAARGWMLMAGLVLGACASTSQQQREGPVVRDLRIAGTKQLSAGEVKGKILTSETSFFDFLPWVAEERFDANAWRADLRRVERYYQARGYYQAEVVDAQVEPAGEDAVRLHLQVKEGMPTRIGRIDVAGLEALPDEHQRKVLAELPLEEGAIFVEESWTGVKDTLQSRLRELGYAEATVEGEVFVDLATQTATVDLQAAPGQRYRFGKIFVSQGPRPKVPRERIIEQAKVELEEGQWYSDSALAEAQSRVFQMGVFGGVKVNRGAPNREKGTVPIIVDVREAPFQSLKAGGGIGVDGSSNEVRGVAEYTNRNFFGDLRRFTGELRAGWTFIPSVFNLRSPESDNGPFVNARVEVEQPGILFRDLRGQLSLEYERGLEPAYAYHSGRARGGLLWQPLPQLGVSLSYNFELYSLQSGRYTSTDASSLGFGCRGLCLLSYLEQTIAWDRRDNPVAPRRGTYVGLSLQEGGGPLGGSFTYLRLLPDVRAYVSFLEGDKLTFAAKLRVGTLLTRGDSDSPIVSRFFSGGAYMRGFNARRLSPMQVVPRDAQRITDPEEPTGAVVPVGGNGLFEASFEARWNFTGNVVLATFLDMGFVSKGAFRPRDIGSANYYAVGLGLRYLTLIGPLRVDFARRLPIGPGLPLDTPVDPRNPERSLFSYNTTRGGFCGFFSGPVRTDSLNPGPHGAPEDACAIHLSIGEAF